QKQSGSSRKDPAPAPEEIQSDQKPEKRWPEKIEDPVLTALKAQWKPLFAEMMSLTSRIYDVAKAGLHDEQQKREAGKMAHRILDLDDECEEIYIKRDHY